MPAQKYRRIQHSGSGYFSLNKIDAVVEKYMQDNKIPGITISGSKNGRLVYEKAFGLDDMLTKNPMKPNTISRIGSCSKILTALAVMKLTEMYPGFKISKPMYGPTGVLNESLWIDAMALGPMAVSPGSQKQGIGGLLIAAGLDACRALGQNVVFVLGHADYYPRFGFEPARKHGSWYKSEEFDPHFFVIGLQDGALDGLSGAVEYHPEFDRF